MNRALAIVAALVYLGAAGARADAGSSHYKIANRFAVPGDSGWDLLAVDDGRVYLSHGTVVQVVDEKTGKLVGTIEGMNRVHGIALVPDLHEGFATCGVDTTVVIFDLKTLKPVKKLTINGVNPDAILYDPASKRVFAFNGRSNNATVIDAATHDIVGLVALPGKPELPAADGRGMMFVNLEDTSMMSAIDTKTLTVKTSWSLAPGTEPTGLAIDTATHRLFSACNNQLMVVSDYDAGKVVTTLPIGERVDGAAFDPGLKRAYASCGDGTLAVIQEKDKNTFSVFDNVPTQPGARTIALDARTHHLFLPTAEFGDPPAATAENPHPRPAIKPGTFVVLDIEPAK
jgi:DNA-binding beta-propeller fold protein YncE